MKVGFFQFNIVSKDPEANRKILYDNLQDKKFDLLVLPELFTTGYLLGSSENAYPYAEEIPNGKTVKLLEKLSKSVDGYIIGSMMEREGDKLYNSAIVVGPEGYVGKQRKLNPTDYESRYSLSGDSVEIFIIRGIKVGVAICFDLWFSELSRYFFNNGVQILCHTANFGGIQSPAIAQARAVENKMFVVSCNRTGREVDDSIEADFRGESRVVDIDGNILAQATGEVEFSVVDIEPGHAKDKHLDFSAEYPNRIRRTEEIIKSAKGFL